MRAQGRRERFHAIGHPPSAGAVLPRRQDDLAGIDVGTLAVRPLDLRSQTPAIRINAGQGRLVPHGNAKDPADPKQVIVPHSGRDQMEFPPSPLAKPRLVPGLIGKRRDPQIGPRIVLRRAERTHARERHPGSFPAIGRPVDHDDIVDLFALQGVGGRDAALSGTDHENVMYGRPIGMTALRQPFQFGMIDRLQIAADLFFEPLQSGFQIVLNVACGRAKYEAGPRG